MKSKTRDRSKGYLAHKRLWIDPSRRSKRALKRKEEALSLSQDRLRALVEMTSDWVWEIDAQGVYTYVSPKVTDLLGYPVEEVLGRTPFDLMPKEESDRIARTVQPLFDNAQPIRNLENINVHKDGHLVMLETSGVPILDTSGDLIGYRGIDRDITDRKRAEEKLRTYVANLKQAEEKYRNIFENCMEGIYQTIPEGRFIHANPSAARLLGYDSPEELVDSITDIRSQVYVHPGDREKIIGLLRKHGVVENFEMQYRKKDGGVAWGLHNLRLVQDDQGNTLYIEGTFQDITKRKVAEETLQLHDEILKNMAEGVCLVRTNGGMIAYANPRFEQMFGYGPGELAGKRISVLNDPNSSETARDIMRQLKANGAWSGDIKNIKKDGVVLWCRATVSTFDHPSYGNVWIGVHEDITNRKQMEEALQENEQRFRSLSEASLEAILFIEDGIIVDANEALNRLLGYDGEDLRGKRATDFIAPELRDLSNERVRTKAEGIYETLGLRKDGSTFPIEINAREFIIDGRSLRITAARDLTERKKIEKQLKDYQEQLEKLVEDRTNELKQSEKKYRNIFENAQEGIFQSTPDGRLISANPALASMFGSGSPEELVALINDIPEQVYVDRARRRELADILAREEFVQDFELKFRCKDGVIKCASMNARAVRDEQGTILYYEGTVQDVTEKKEAEKALEAEHRNLEEANNALMEANAALNVLLKHHDKERKELEQRFLGNVQQLVMPYIERLKKSSLDPIQQISVNFIASNLKELVSPFLKNIHGFNLTPRQLEVASLIKEGRTTKDIGRILNMNQRAVEIQRFLIRKKLGFNKEKTNLQTYLKSLS